MLKGRRGITQARGRARREQLLEAARLLLQTHEIDELTLSVVAAHAGIPKSSTYHFYADIHALYAELAAIEDRELHAVFLEEVSPAADWESVLAALIHRAADYFRAHRSAQQLMFGPKTPPDIKRSSRQVDLEHSQAIEGQIDRQFVLPEIPDRSRIFYRAIEAVDLMFGLSLLEEGVLTDHMVDEAIKMASAYLSLYIPKILHRRA
ncbi:TetR/AcrR family transcriptional regulator [Flavisphingomonas formosensis]|uniref:TetR/AcrR family transcriptional regulator n=1 Tax=Flavisphingomonas formosensis TaxID=861534 RepID=UPI0012FCF4D9|nr:TetR family transcriptional regulator [Sphingomonas formosensis]